MTSIKESISELIDALGPNQRLLGLDVGEKTIGLAVGDLMHTIATPLVTIKRSKFTKDMVELQKMIDEKKVGGLVIGYPINMNGTEGPRCQSIRQFTRNVMEKCGLPALLWDERMSTMAVTRTLLEADVSRQKRAEVVDKLAAGYILQGALDQHAARRSV